MTCILLSAAIVIFAANILGTITGFGVVVMAFPFITGLLGIYEAKVLLGIVGWTQGLYILARNYRDIDVRHYFRIILGTILGMPIGIWFFTRLPGDTLKFILGFFIAVVALTQLYLQFTHRPLSKKAPGWAFALLLFFGGIVHGAFGIAGPFVVIYAARYIRNTQSFRSTLSLVWVTVNTFLFTSDPTFYPFFNQLGNFLADLFQGSLLLPEYVAHLFFVIPFIGAGIFVGERLLCRVNTSMFRQLVFSVLLATGTIMMGGAVF